jgi:hypothetical protein
MSNFSLGLENDGKFWGITKSLFNSKDDGKLISFYSFSFSYTY